MQKNKNQPLTFDQVCLNQLVFVRSYSFGETKLPGVIVDVKSRFVTVEWTDHRNNKFTANFTRRIDGVLRFDRNPRTGKRKNATMHNLLPRKESAEILELRSLVAKLQEENAKLKEELNQANFFAQAYA